MALQVQLQVKVSFRREVGCDSDSRRDNRALESVGEPAKNEKAWANVPYSSSSLADRGKAGGPKLSQRFL